MCWKFQIFYQSVYIHNKVFGRRLGWYVFYLRSAWFTNIYVPRPANLICAITSVPKSYLKLWIEVIGIPVLRPIIGMYTPGHRVGGSNITIRGQKPLNTQAKIPHFGRHKHCIQSNITQPRAAWLNLRILKCGCFFFCEKKNRFCYFDIRLDETTGIPKQQIYRLDNLILSL